MKINKIALWLAIISLIVIMGAVVPQLPFYIFRKDHIRMSKLVDNTLIIAFHDNIKINGSPSEFHLTFHKWIKHIIFNKDGFRIDLVIFKYYLRKEVNVWNTSQSLAILPHACQSSDNLFKDSVLCNDMPMKGSKTLVLARKNYWVRIYWKDTTQLSLERVIGVAQGVEKTILEN